MIISAHLNAYITPLRGDLPWIAPMPRNTKACLLTLLTVLFWSTAASAFKIATKGQFIHFGDISETGL